MEKIERVLALVHCDTDGVASAAAIRCAHADQGAHVKVEFADYGNIDDKLHKALTRTANAYDRIVVADISWRPFEDVHADLAVRAQIARVLEQELAGMVKLTDSDLRQLGSKLKASEVKLAHDGMYQSIKQFRDRGGELVVLDHHPRALAIAKEYKNQLHPLSILETHDAQGVMRAGSELAARYYMSVRTQAFPGRDEAVVDFGRLAGDYDVWRDPHGPGGKLAMGVMRMDDNHEALLAMETLIAIASTLPQTSEGIDWYRLIVEHGGLLGHYMLEAEAEYGQALAEALTTLEHPSEHLASIYTTEFSSLISDHVYQTYPVVATRYKNDKTKVDKISLRTGRNDLDLGQLLKPLGGGGHPKAAGLSIPVGTYEEKLTAIVAALQEKLAS